MPRRIRLVRILLAAAGLVLPATCGGGGSPCGPALTDCGGYCADLSSNETDCGACGATCAPGDYCDRGVCIVGVCTADDSACNYDSECCSDYCASDGNCGCIPVGRAGCAGPTDCCSGHCARDGVCDP
jgi:hypothetical protein